jgi:hypothetical protein
MAAWSSGSPRCPLPRGLPRRAIATVSIVTDRSDLPFTDVVAAGGFYAECLGRLPQTEAPPAAWPCAASPAIGWAPPEQAASRPAAPAVLGPQAPNFPSGPGNIMTSIISARGEFTVYVGREG